MAAKPVITSLAAKHVVSGANWARALAGGRVLAKTSIESLYGLVYIPPGLVPHAVDKRIASEELKRVSKRNKKEKGGGRR